MTFSFTCPAQIFTNPSIASIWASWMGSTMPASRRGLYPPETGRLIHHRFLFGLRWWPLGAASWYTSIETYLIDEADIIYLIGYVGLAIWANKSVAFDRISISTE